MSLMPSDDDEDTAGPQLGVLASSSSERYTDGLAGEDTVAPHKHPTTRSGRSRSGTSFSDGLDSPFADGLDSPFTGGLPMQLGDDLMLSDDELHLGDDSEMYKTREYSTKLFGGIAYLQRLSDNFGRHFVYQLLSTYLLVKGLTMELVSGTMLPFFRAKIGVSGRDYQIYTQVIFIPWSIKALMGATSDLYPLFGYHKRSYMLVATGIGSLSLAVLGGTTFTADNAKAAVPLLFLVMFQVAMVDLLCEGKYAEMMRKLPHTKGDAVSFVAMVDLLCEGKYAEILRKLPQTKGDAVSFVWGSVVLGGLLAAPVVGPFADHFDPQYIFFIAFPFAIQVAFPLLRGYLPEDFVPRERRTIQYGKLRDNKRLFTIAFLMAAGAMTMGVVNLTAGNAVILAYSIVSSAVLSTLGFLWMPRLLAMCNFYMFLQEALYIQIPGALDYWYTAPPECVPDGPNFDFSFFITLTKVIGSIAGIIGVTVFQTIMSNWSFRACFWISTVIRMVASLFDIFIVSRTNIALGIPDKFAYMFGDAFVYTLASMMFFMPSVILTSKICPKGYESTTYALLAGFQNFGQNVAKSVGVFMMGAFGIRTEAPCDFTNLGALVFAAHFVLPALTVPLAFVFLPKAKLSDDLEKEVRFGGEGSDSRVEFATLEDMDQAANGVLSRGRRRNGEAGANGEDVQLMALTPRNAESSEFAFATDRRLIDDSDDDEDNDDDVASFSRSRGDVAGSDEAGTSRRDSDAGGLSRAAESSRSDAEVSAASSQRSLSRAESEDGDDGDV